MVSNYKQGWHPIKHLATSIMYLNREPTKLLKDNITVLDVEQEAAYNG
jgi:hypothetical protein